MTTTCCFCAHPNPGGAKFCNECASPMHLRPCRECDAVNVREAESCYRCGAPFATLDSMAGALGDAAIASEQIVAQADETLAALKRQLAGSEPATAAAAFTEVPRDIEAARRIDVLEAVRAPSAAWTAGPGGDPSPQTFAPAGADQAPQVPEPPAAQPPGEAATPALAASDDSFEEPTLEPRFDATSVPLTPHEREWRPARRSRMPIVALIAAIVAIPVVVWLVQNPQAIDDLAARFGAARPSPDTATVEAPSHSVAQDAAPEQTPASTSPTTSAPPAAAASDATTTAAADDTVAPPSAAADTTATSAAAPPATPPAATPLADRAEAQVVMPAGEGAPPALPADAATAAGAVQPAAATAAAPPAPEQATAAAQTPKPARATARKPPPRTARAGSSARSRPPDRAPSGRGATPAPPRARQPSSATAPGPRTEPCSEAVAALGLCPPGGRAPSP